MIFTACPSCDEPQAFGWNPGDPVGHFPSKCGKCSAVMWVEATSMGGETLSHERFMDTVVRPGDEAEVGAAAARARVLSQMVA